MTDPAPQYGRWQQRDRPGVWPAIWPREPAPVREEHTRWQRLWRWLRRRPDCNEIDILDYFHPAPTSPGEEQQ
jgi:hypothetical protein